MEKELSFRKKIGLSQDVYAQYLCISKGMLSLVELGLRRLPPKASEKNALLWLRWLEFEKNCGPIQPDPNWVEGARKEILKRIKAVIGKKATHTIRMEEARERIDFQKANRFLEEEIARIENPDDLLYFQVTLRRNKKKQKQNDFLEALEMRLEEKFLDFQLSGYQMVLEELGGSHLNNQ